MELGVEDGIIVTRTYSLGAGLTKQIAFSKEAGDLGDQYNSFLDCEEVEGAGNPGDVLINRDGKLMRPKRLPSNLYRFRPGTGEDRCVMRSEEHTSELQSLMRISDDVFCLQKKK